jgi:glycerol-3-phosphate dehydrogenase
MVTWDVIIIGGGIIGTALARELSKYDLGLLLLEKEVDLSWGTSKANSGIVHSGLHDRPGSLRAKLCVEGNRLYPTLVQELQVLYANNGALVVARGSDEMERLQRLYQQGLTNGVTGLNMINRARLLSLEPNLTPELSGALLASTGGIVVPFDLVYALAENAQANGVKILARTVVQGIRPENDGVFVETSRGEYYSRYVVNAAGVYAGRIAESFGDDSVVIEPRKGEEYLLDRRLHGLVKHTIFPLPTQISKGILVIPTVDGNIMIGPTAHSAIDLEDKSTQASGWEEVYESVRKLVPSLEPSDRIASFAGLRAVTTKDDFIIGVSPKSRRVLHAAGISSPGLTAAPAIAAYLTELLQNEGLALRRRRHYNPIRRILRPRELSEAEQNILMTRNPEYAQIVCRCESISLGEIRDAIRRGATTVDGIKLRTRCGMGRCQGGFCTPKVIQILSEELKIPPESITKMGPGSELLKGRIR